MAQIESTAFPKETPALARRPAMLWLSASFWLISGLLGIAPILTTIPAFIRADTSVLTFVGIAALSHLLSLAGAIQLIRRRLSAVPLLTAVYVLYISSLLFFTSPATWSLFRMCLVAISSCTVGYAFNLKRKGILS